MRDLIMQSKVSIVSFSLFLLSGFFWKHIFELFKWNEQFGYGPIPTPKRNAQETVEVSQIESNCGILDACALDSFPVYLSTGSAGESLPKLCISGKHLLPTNGPEPKGLNAAVVEPTRFEIISVRNFDTYRLNKTTEIVLWLGELIDNDILIIFTSGESSIKLTNEVLRLLNNLGSGLVQNLRYRSQWFMITQKGTRGFTAFEKMSFPKNKRWWGDLIEFKSCVPRKVPKHRTVADETLHENKLRTNFCNGKTDDKYKGFCQESRFELIIPSLLTNRSLIGNPAYSSPFFLYASNNFELLVASMDSLLHQPGVFVPLITVLYSESQTDVPDIARMYGMQARKVSSFGRTFLDKLNQARRISQKENSEQPFIIVVDQNVILSPDFLFFMAQTINTIKTDGTVAAISAWSPNCYSHEGDVHLSYRIEGSPKYAALVPVQPRNDIFGEIIVPDVSRIQGPKACHLPSLEPDNWISRPHDLTKERYFHKLVMLQQLGHVVDVQTVLSNCSETVLDYPVNTIYYNYDDNNLSNIVHCLGIAGDQFGIYEGIVRLTVSQKTVLIISNESSFYRSRPITSQALTQGQPKTSASIGLAYRSPHYFSYERGELGRIPNFEVNKPFSADELYSTTYSSTFVRPSDERDLTNLMKKYRCLHSEFPKLAKSFPCQLKGTEYRTQYPQKQLPECVKGSNVEQLTSCPLILTGRDERDPVPLTNNIAKYLDIYVSTARQDYRRYSEAEQKSIATKEVVTAHETMEIPKGKGYGMKGPALAGQDLEKRDKNMTDAVFSTKEFKLRQLHKPAPMIPPQMNSEYGTAYAEPKGLAKRLAFSSFVEYPERNVRSATQAVCPPGMFSTEYDVINKHTTPQTVV